MAPGTRRLLRLAVPSPVKAVERQLDPRTRLVLGANPDGSLAALLDDCADAAVDALARRTGVDARRVRAAARPGGGRAGRRPPRHRRARRKGAGRAHEVQAGAARQAAAGAGRGGRRHPRAVGPAAAAGFVTATGAAHLGDLTRYLTAIARRLERLPQGVDADRDRMARVHAVQDAYDELRRRLPPARAAAADVRDIARLIEELRVSLWAQQLGTPRPVSEQRIYRAIDAVGH